MSSNFSNNPVFISEEENSEQIKRAFDLIIAYLSITIIIFGLIGNTACFLIFRFDKQMSKMSSNIYLSYCSITDSISLLVWNLDHFTVPVLKIEIDYISLFSCRFFSFFQYYSLQSSAWFLSFMCIDRFFSVISIPGSFSSRLPFFTTKSAHIWSVLILITLFLVNLHVLILNGYVDSAQYKNVTVWINNNKTEVNSTFLVQIKSDSIKCYSSLTTSFETHWERIHLFIYSFVPFLIMLVFNSMLIAKIFGTSKISHSANKSAKPIQNSRDQKNNKGKLSVSLLVITISFVVMTCPGSVLYGYFEINKGSLRYCFFKLSDFLGFFNRASLFFCCFLTNLKFRSIVIRVFSKPRINVEQEN